MNREVLREMPWIADGQHGRFAESSKLEPANKAKLKGMGYGG